MGDRVKVDIMKGVIENLTTGEKIQVDPLADFLMEILKAGGIQEKMLMHKSEYKHWA